MPLKYDCVSFPLQESSKESLLRLCSLRSAILRVWSFRAYLPSARILRQFAGKGNITPTRKWRSRRGRRGLLRRRRHSRVREKIGRRGEGGRKFALGRRAKTGSSRARTR